MYPSVAKLEQALSAYLSTRIAANISPIHPSSKADIGTRPRMTISFVNDIAEGRWLTRHMAEPSIQFVFYTVSYALSRQLQEQLIAIMEGISSIDMQGQDATRWYKVNSFGSLYEQGSALFVSGVEYRFLLTHRG